MTCSRSSDAQCDCLRIARQFPTTHSNVDPEDLPTLALFDTVCGRHWPMWIALSGGQPVAWWDECTGNAGAVPSICSDSASQVRLDCLQRQPIRQAD